MINSIRKNKLDELIEKTEKEATNIRNILNDIVIYTEGSYNIKDLFIMPLYFIKEILDRIDKKNEKLKEELDKSSNKHITRF